MPYAGLERHEFVIPVLHELPKIREYICGLYDAQGISIGPNIMLDKPRTHDRFAASVHKCLDDFASIPEPSLFKICAAITLAFMQCPDVGPSFLKTSRISKLPKHQNAYVILTYCRRILTGAKMGRKGSKQFKLAKPFDLSDHFTYDLIQLLGKSRPTFNNFNMLALLYETLVYKTNPQVQGPSIF